MNSKKYFYKIPLISFVLLLAICLCSCASNYAFHGVPLVKDSEGRSQSTNTPINDRGEGYNVPDVTETETDNKESETTAGKIEEYTFNDEEPIVLKDLDKYFAELEKELENIEEEREEIEEYVEPDPDYEKIETTAFSGKYDFYDVPLHPMKQQWVIETAEAFNISPIMIFGVMKVESNYNETSISSNGKYIGIMQVAKGHLTKLNSYFGITDLQDFQQCTYAGAYYLSYYVSYSKRLNTKYYGGNKDIDDMTLMCYHRGEGGATNVWDKGTFSDSYSTKVKNEMARIAKVGPVSAEYVIKKYGFYQE